MYTRTLVSILVHRCRPTSLPNPLFRQGFCGIKFSEKMIRQNRVFASRSSDARKVSGRCYAPSVYIQFLIGLCHKDVVLHL